MTPLWLAEKANLRKISYQSGIHKEPSCFIRMQSIKGETYRDLLLSQLDLGEAETIILAKELNHYALKCIGRPLD